MSRHRLHQISITRPVAGRFIFLPSQPPSTRTGTKDDVTDTIETATLYERHMRSSSRSDEEPLQIEFSSVAATSDPHWYEGCRQALPARGKHSNSKTPGRISSVCRSAVARRCQRLPHLLDLRQRRVQRHFRRFAFVAFMFKAALLPCFAFAPRV